VRGLRGRIPSSRPWPETNLIRAPREQLPGATGILIPRSQPHTPPRSQHPCASGAALRRPPPADPGPHVALGCGSLAQRSIPRRSSPAPPLSLCPYTSPTAERPNAPAARTPPELRAPGEETKVSQRRPESLSPPRPCPAPAPSPAALRSATPGAAPAQETLRTCPGSQDSGGGEGSRQSEPWRPASNEGGWVPRLCRPAPVRGRVGGSASIPCPSSPACAHPNTRTYTRVCRLLCRRLPLLSLPLPSSCWPETHFASARHPEISGELCSGAGAGSCYHHHRRRRRRRPRHLRRDTRGWRLRLPPSCCRRPFAYPGVPTTF
jgi:hypothetical protein